MEDTLSVILSYLNVHNVLSYRLTNNSNNLYVCTKLLKKYIIKVKSDNIDKYIN